MDRRRALQVFLLTGFSLTSFSVFKWVDLNKDADLGFLESQKLILADLAELIIPKTETPGAKDANVQEFIVMMLRDSTDAISLNNFIYGLKQLVTYTKTNYNAPFTACSINEQTEILKYFEEKGSLFNGIAGKIQHKLLGRPFFTTLKNYTVMGYCTALQGATQGLSYDYIPVNFISCYPVKPAQKSWATK